MMKKQNRLSVMITAILLCVLVIFSTTMVGCNKRDEGRVEAPDVTDDIPEPEEPDDKEEEKKPEENKEDDKKPEENQQKPADPGTTTPTTPAAPTTPSTTTPSKPTTTTPTKPAATKYDDVIFNKAGTYSKSMYYNDGTVKKSGVIIKNKTFKGNVVIDSAVGKGKVDFNNVDIEGTLYVYGGGSNSNYITLTDCNVKKMVVDRDSYAVRVLASGKTEVSSILIKDDTILQEKTMTKGYDGFKNVLVDGPRSGLKLSLKGLKLNKLTTDSKCEVNMDGKTIVNVFYADAATALTGTGEVEKLIASSSYVTYEEKPNKIQTVDGAKRPRPAENDDDDDDWDDDDWDTRPTVSLSGINNQTVQQGSSITLGISTNGTSLSASSNNTSVAEVSVSGSSIVVSGKQAGTATINVTAARSGYWSRTVSFTVTVTASPTNNPVITIVQAPTTSWTNQDYAVKFKVTDVNRNLNKVTVNGTEVTGAADEYSFTVTQNGEYKILATDHAGHTTELTFTVANIDKELLEITDLKVSDTAVSFKVKDDSNEDCTVTTTVDGKSTPLNQDSTGGYSFVPEKGKVYTITVTDKAGNKTDEIVKIEEPTQDVTAVSVDTPVVDNPYAQAQSKTVTFKVNVPSGQTVNVVVTSPSNNNVPVGSAPVTTRARGFAVTYAFTAEESGNYTIAVTENGVTTTKIINVAGIDRTPPAISDVEVNGTTITFNVNDDTANVTVNGVPVAKIAENNNQYSYDTKATATAVYTIKAVDTVGNEATQSVTVTVEEPPKDTTPPVISSIAKSTTGATNQNVVLTFNVTDDTGVATVTVTPECAVTSNGDSYSFAAAENGSYTITAADASGNKATQTVEISNIDKIAPEYKISNNPAGYTKQKVITFTAADAGSGISSVIVSHNNNNVAVTGTYQFTAIENGSYIVTIVDNAGNKTENTVTVSYIDTTAPAAPTLKNDTIVLKAIVSGGTVEQQEFSADKVFKTTVVPKTGDNVGNTVKAQYSTDGNNWKDVPAEGFTLAEGEYTLQVRAIDMAGNISTVQKYAIKITSASTEPTE